MYYHHPLIFVFALLGLFSCGTPMGVEAELGRIEGYIQEEPRRALEELSVMNRDSLSRAQDRGRYSLLLSMALDKNVTGNEKYSNIGNGTAAKNVTSVQQNW